MIKNIKLTGNVLYIITVVCIIAAVIFFRTQIWLYEPGLAGDEGSLVYNIQTRNFFRLFTALDLAQCCPPVFLVFGKIIYNIWGLNETALRFLPYISGVLSIILIPFLFNKLFKIKILSLIIIPILGYNNNLCYYSQEFKQYSSDFLLTVIYLYLFVIFKDKIPYDSNLIKFSIISGIILGLGGFFSLPCVFITAPMFLHLAVKLFKSKKLKELSFFILSYFTGLLMQFFTYIYGTMSNGILDCWTEEEQILSSMHNISYLFNTLIGFIDFRLLIVLFFIGIIYMLIKERVLAFILITPIVLNAISGYLHLYPFTVSRVILYLFPVIYIILLKPLDILHTKKPILNCIIYILIFSISLLNFVNIYKSRQWPLNINGKTYYYFMSNSKEYIQNLNKLNVNPDDIIYVGRTGDGIFQVYDTDKKYVKNMIFQNMKPLSITGDILNGQVLSLDDIPKGSKIYFYNDIIAAEFNDTYDVIDWVKNNTKTISSQKDDIGEFLYVQKIK